MVTNASPRNLFGNWIYLAVSVAVIPTMIGGYLYYRQVITQQRNDLKGNLRAIAETSAKDTSRQLDFWHQSLSNFGQLRIFDVAIDYDRYEGIEDFFESIVKSDTKYRGLLMVDVNGKLLASARKVLTSTGAKSSVQEWETLLGEVNYATAGGNFGVVEGGPYSGSVIVSAPIMDLSQKVRGKLIGVFSNTFALDALAQSRDLYSSSHKVQLEYSTTLNQGNWNANLGKSEKWTKMPLEGSLRFCGNYGDSNKIVAMSCLSAEKVQIYSQISGNTLMALILILFSALGFGLAMYYGMWSVTRTVRIILRKLEEISDGDYSKLDEIRVGDIDYYVKIANRLIDKMETFRLKADENVRASAVANLTSMLAHDVRKPFSMLKSGLSILSQTTDPEKFSEKLEYLQRSVGRAADSVDGMILDIMEISSTSTTLELEAVAPEVLIEAALLEVFRIYPKSNISIFYDLDAGALISVNVPKIGRLLSNILANAVQEMRLEGSIWFRTVDVGGFLEITIGNSGSQISEANLSKVFEPFFTSGKKSGTGLGLAIAKKVVEDHGGSICCNSSASIQFPEGQVEFVFTLPLSDSYADDLGRVLPGHSCEVLEQINSAAGLMIGSIGHDASENAIEAELLAINKPIRVLIVDDEELYRSNLEALVNKSAELRKIVTLSHASGSDSAIEALRNEPFDLVITDVDMGADSLSGFDLVSVIREDFGFQGVICIHSNRLVMADHKTAITKGADSFLPKPMARVHLLKILLQAGKRVHADSVSSEVQILPEIAVVEDDVFIVEMWVRKLAGQAHVHVFLSPETFQRALAAEPDLVNRLDMVITDYYFDEIQETGADVGEMVKSLCKDIPVILCSNGEFNLNQFSGSIDRVISKSPREYKDLLAVVSYNTRRESQKFA